MMMMMMMIIIIMRALTWTLEERLVMTSSRKKRRDSETRDSHLVVKDGYPSRNTAFSAKSSRLCGFSVSAPFAECPVIFSFLRYIFLATVLHSPSRCSTGGGA
jgi:hypothetical protein